MDGHKQPRPSKFSAAPPKTDGKPEVTADHLMPYWMGWLLVSPMRKWLHNPTKMLGSYVQPGYKVLDAGCAMGFFSLPMAAMVGPQGQVVSVDVEARAIKRLRRRAKRAGLVDRMVFRICHMDSLALDDFAHSFDFALAFYMLGELSGQEGRIMTELAVSLRPGGQLLLTEPKAFTKREQFANTLSLAADLGLELVSSPAIRGSFSALFRRGQL